MSNVLLVCLFQENKSYGSTKPFHSSSDVQESRVGHNDNDDNDDDDDDDCAYLLDMR
jgi:hypothetical protein